jgi:hypothetical protein
MSKLKEKRIKKAKQERKEKKRKEKKRKEKKRKEKKKRKRKRRNRMYFFLPSYFFCFLPYLHEISGSDRIYCDVSCYVL